jgi:hypothetical protein
MIESGELLLVSWSNDILAELKSNAPTHFHLLLEKAPIRSWIASVVSMTSKSARCPFCDSKFFMYVGNAFVDEFFLFLESMAQSYPEFIRH